MGPTIQQLNQREVYRGSSHWERGRKRSHRASPVKLSIRRLCLAGPSQQSGLLASELRGDPGKCAAEWKSLLNYMYIYIIDWIPSLLLVAGFNDDEVSFLRGVCSTRMYM